MEPSVKITIDLQQDGLNKIVAQQEQIVVVRSFSETDDYVVICAAFSPLGLENTLEFQPNWAIYTSQQALTPDSSVKMLSEHKNITIGNTYSFSSSGFGYDSAAYLPTALGFDNETAQDLQFGIAQPISINDGEAVTSPLAIVTGLAKQTTYLTPLPEVKVFLATNLSAKQICPVGILHLPHPTTMASRSSYALSVGSYLAVDITADATIYFDSTNNCFTLNPPPVS